MSSKKISIGLFGFGVVGQGLYTILQQTPQLATQIVRVCIKHKEKERKAPSELFTTDKDALLNDENIDVIIELIDDADAAYTIVKQALLNGKNVITANKKMIAHHFEELLQLQKQTGKALLYEASACASIPIIRNLEEYYNNDFLQGISGIVNGSTNYILTQMKQSGASFQEALLQAQSLGFAESNPKLDVEGYDAVNKWSILLAHAYGIIQHPDEIIFTGIQHIHKQDILVAAAQQQQIKLVAEAKKLKDGTIAAFVLPKFVQNDEHLAFAKNEYNAIVLESGFAEQQFFLGKGAGSLPTASAVLSDIAALQYDYKYEYKKLHAPQKTNISYNYSLRVYLSFSNLSNIKKEDFITIEQWNRNENRSYIIGLISPEKLQKTTWWKSYDNSLILMPDAINDEAKVQEAKKKSLQLAGALV